ncbi:MAG: hypothetical protein QF598_08070 [Arenicellales bacterium]|jgi:hypothetical protein|nr:hypothetical protein [Arenicellales bacterium]MDP6855448.1 hypothetical protein [Arenicellales bacterium]|tara:strand:+ start:919 stop:1158 length:240 start_codon:yes stop_codon:yes gene_type:complete
MKVMILVLGVFICGPIWADTDKRLEDKPITDLTVGELRLLIQVIVNETLERCVVEGKMEGKSTLSLRVLGDVKANINCS